MRFEELAYRDGGQAVTIPFHRTLTVLGGLDADLRRRFAERTVASLGGRPAGHGVSLVFVDGSGSRVHLVRDPRGGTTVTDLDSGEDLAEHAGRRRRPHRLAAARRSRPRRSCCCSTRPSSSGRTPAPATRPSTADEGELAEARAVLAQVEEEYQPGRGPPPPRGRASGPTSAASTRRSARPTSGPPATATRTPPGPWPAWKRSWALLRGAEPAERRVAEAAVAAVRLAGEHRAATAALDEARTAFGDRRRLDHRSLARALGLPADAPDDLERLQADFLAAARRRAELVARLDAGAASDLPAPSTPWVLALARQPHPELWLRAERVSDRPHPGRGAVDGPRGRRAARRPRRRDRDRPPDRRGQAERDVDSARIKPLAVAAKRRLAKAREDEQAVLDRAGFVTWLSFQMRRIDVLLEPDALEALRVAELEHQVAAVAWAELAGDVDPEAALAARAEIERYSA